MDNSAFEFEQEGRGVPQDMVLSAAQMSLPDEICAIDNTQEYCHTRDYGKVCQLDIINNEITDKTNDTILYNNECLKIKPFMNKLPYTITKK